MPAMFRAAENGCFDSLPLPSTPTSFNGAQLHLDFFRQLNHDFKQYRRPIVKAGRAQTREGLSKQAFRHSCFQGVRLFM